MSDSDDDMAAAPLTPLELAMEALNTIEERIVPLYNAGCCQSCGHYEGGHCRHDRRARGYVFWHDGCIDAAALDGVLTLYHRSFSNSDRMNKQVAQRVVRVFESYGMGVRWGGEAHHAIHVELDAEDQAYFEDRLDDIMAEDEERDMEWFADSRWRKKVYRAFLGGLRANRDAFVGFRRRRAARIIKDAVMDWAFRPGGVGHAGAKRQFEDISS